MAAKSIKYAIGVDLGGTFIKFGLVANDGCLVYENILPTEADVSSDRVIANIIFAIQQTLNYAEKNNIQPVGIGIGIPGIVDKSNRVVVAANNISGWSNINLADEIEWIFSLPVSLNNDANMMALGEQAFGSAKDYSDVIFLTVGTGIGGAIIINNKLYAGYDNRGAELGHIPLFADGLTCSCGSIGCLEAYASTSSLVNQFKNLCIAAGVILPEEITGKLLVKLLGEKNQYAIVAFNNHFRYLGQGIAGLVNIFSPQLVVLGGGISEAGSFYLNNIKDRFNQFVVPSCAVNTRLTTAKLGNKAGILGSAQWVFQNPMTN